MNFKETVASVVMWSFLATIFWCCGQNKNIIETTIDSLATHGDSAVEQSIVVKDTDDPNVYEIPADYPWLLQLISERFPWDSVSTCARISAFDDLFPEASTTKEQIGDNLIAVYTYKDSYIKVAQLHIDEMQDCSDNICEVVLTSDWVPIGSGLHVGMTKSEFNDILSLDNGLTQNVYTYIYTHENSDAIKVVFEFKNETMASFSYEVDRCVSRPTPVPWQPFLKFFFNKPFLSTNPDSVQKLIKTGVKIEVERNSEHVLVDSINDTDMYPEFKFDSSSIKFRKWSTWEIVQANLKSPNFSFINGLKVGMTRAAFLKTMCVRDFKGDKFHKSNESCSDGFESRNDFTVFFKDGVIREIQYERLACQ
jgi:hypothetical protein